MKPISSGLERLRAHFIRRAQDAHTVDASLTLFGFPARDFELRVTDRPAGARRLRALAVACATALGAPLAFLIPPHMEPLLVALFAGAYFARREWIAEYVVASGSGACPRCDGPMSVRRGSTMRFPLALTCDSCLHSCTLQAGRAAETPAAPRPRRAAPVRVTADERAIAAFWRRNRAAAYSAWSPGSSDWRDR